MTAIARATVASLLATWLVASPLRAAEPAAAEVDFFEQHIRPVLVQHCYECHSTGKKRQGGLLLDSRNGVQTGGDSGPAIVAGEPDESVLLRALRGDDGIEMPPKGRLPASVIANFERWIELGAPDPRGELAAAPKKPDEPTAAADHWAFQPLRSATTDGIDVHVRAALKQAGLAAPAAAERRVWLRRVTFDLIGLPPTPAELEAFLGDDSPTAYEAVVDRLLASPQFGERFGRHWLDVARYADSNGGGANMVFDDAWRYRDYVIDAFHSDLPFDQLLRQQIAGDLLPAADDAARHRQTVATGFLLVGPKELAEYDKQKLRMDIVDEQLDTIGKAFLGLSIGCARCHDHKFDPIPTRDYYALAGVLSSTTSHVKNEGGGPISKLPRRPLPTIDATRAQALRQSLDERLADARDRLAKAQAALAAAGGPGKADMPTRTAVDKAQGLINERQRELNEFRETALAVADAEKPQDCRIHIRGDVNNLGPAVPRGFLSIVPKDEVPALAGSGRRELADWLAGPAAPLVARVYVNRLWHWLFGAGLVRSVDDFGARGERPSHPALLEDLAQRLVAANWSTKAIVREIALSHTYRAGGKFDAAAAQIDPENRLLWRFPRRRLDSDALRDAWLAASEQLDATRGGPTNVLAGRLGTESDTEYLRGDPWRRRTVYSPIYRGGFAPDVLRTFDFPDSGLVTGRRNTTIVPTQALLLMNSPLVAEQAEHLARRVARDDAPDAQRIDQLHLILYARPASQDEQARDAKFLDAYVAEAPATRDQAWAALALVLMTSNEFLFVD